MSFQLSRIAISSLLLLVPVVLLQLLTSLEIIFRGDETNIAALLQYTYQNMTSAKTSDSSPSTTDESFSMCLLVMDENPRLVEFLAYHYYALNLRHVVIAIDPYSSERPTELVNRWKDRMEIELWEDSTYMSAEEVQAAKRVSQTRLLKNHDKHRARQVLFYKRCAQHLKLKKRTWTAFYDVDEFISMNGALLNQTEELSLQPSHIETLFHEYRALAAKQSNESAIRYHFGKDCILLPRIIFGHTESADEDVERNVPNFVNPYRFDTLRWRHWTTRGQATPGKALVDLSRVPDENFAVDAFSNIHRPFEICKRSHAFVAYDLPIGLHHYIGSWEQYMYRKNDSRYGIEDRRSRSHFLKKGGGSVKVDDTIRPWIKGFAKFLDGDLELVRYLLKDTGLPSNRSRAFEMREENLTEHAFNGKL